MGLDEELDKIEDGVETQAEQIDEETELKDVEEFQDDELFDPQAEESDLEEAYEGFFAEEGPDGEGETSPDGYDGGLAAVVEKKTGLDLSEEGFHIVGDDDPNALEDELAEEGMLDECEGDELAEDDEDVTIDEPIDENDDFEVVELEIDDDDIVAYLEDEDGNRVGFVVMEEGEEVEYFYVDDEGDVVKGDTDEDNEFDLGITKEGVAQATSDVNAIYKDGIAVVSELKDAVFDIKEAFDFGFLKKK
ncbi:MAG: hypothetical protein RSG23_09030 [Gordonibacter sp.]|uniref:hypothetical protein n=1 Tax=Gordonibacter sp. TaxID=1968902 RepID=UPI002FC5FB1E